MSPDQQPAPADAVRPPATAATSSYRETRRARRREITMLVSYGLLIAILGLIMLSIPALATPQRNAALGAFAAHCFSPHLTAETAARALAPHGRHDFYDLAPFSADRPSPAESAEDVTPGTDRRCELAFDGTHGGAAAETALAALVAEGIRREAPLALAPRPDEATSLRGARFLNPARIAVVETGTRPGPNGPETFLRVERLTPGATAEAIR
ncbi:hypothetical protein [Jannaschia seohaensis]|uniref:Uncharacterized protein n=1 Tax=Jannaschia seohaensis TaxID=475081 RepID=A0A2Y9A1U0_9RHOB|nr:hypothetical protein [Jannaschia seohaensis]PWJ22076.1 hypothetical protein BCF38_101485 [Jannaschia seohaensis]SSA38354.1 hypothetical protein SAMN05421539_101485 [Jannaschia seohaensis]